MDITEDGHRCFGCAQQAVIRGHEQAAADQMTAHNRAVALTAGTRFFSIVFHCADCNERLPRGPGLLSFAPPPASVACPGCGRRAIVGFVHRANWWHDLSFKLALPVALLALVLTRDGELVTALVLGLIYAFLSAAALSLLLALIVRPHA
jgi:hypothetical protein